MAELREIVLDLAQPASQVGGEPLVRNVVDRALNGVELRDDPLLDLLDLLSQAPRTVEDLADLAGLGVGNTSQHLKVLREAGLVESEKRGLYVTCHLAGDDVARFLVAMRRLAEEHLAELPMAMRRVLGGKRPAEAVDGPELVARMRRGEVVVLDVRPGSDGGKVVMLAPDATDGERSFLASRVVTLPWDMGTTVAAVAS